MKTTLRTTLTFVLISLMLVACSSSDDSNSNSGNTTQDVVNAAQSGNWIITYFFDTDSEETNNFTGYVFTFGSNGVLTATNGSTTVTGSWSVTDSNSNDDSPDDLHFNISFSTPADFQDLTDDWEILNYTSSIIELRDVSGGNGGTDLLTFEKE